MHVKTHTEGHSDWRFGCNVDISKCVLYACRSSQQNGCVHSQIQIFEKKNENILFLSSIYYCQFPTISQYFKAIRLKATY